MERCRTSRRGSYSNGVSLVPFILIRLQLIHEFSRIASNKFLDASSSRVVSLVDKYTKTDFPSLCDELLNLPRDLSIYIHN